MSHQSPAKDDLTQPDHLATAQEFLRMTLHNIGIYKGSMTRDQCDRQFDVRGHANIGGERGDVVGHRFTLVCSWQYRDFRIAGIIEQFKFEDAWHPFPHCSFLLFEAGCSSGLNEKHILDSSVDLGDEPQRPHEWKNELLRITYDKNGVISHPGGNPNFDEVRISILEACRHRDPLDFSPILYRRDRVDNLSHTLKRKAEYLTDQVAPTVEEIRLVSTKKLVGTN